MAIKANEPLEKVSGIYFIELLDFNNEQNALPIKEPDNSQGIRSDLYKQGINYLLDRKFLGIGSGNVEWYNYKNKANTQNVTSVHFYWLELAINGVF